MGWTAAANEISIAAWALFAMQFLWQFPHFFAIAWMYRDEYKKAGILMLPVLDPEGRLTFRQVVLFAIMLFPLALLRSFWDFGADLPDRSEYFGIVVPVDERLRPRGRVR
jgi:heme o synthase